jgi:hypothetical protein
MKIVNTDRTFGHWRQQGGGGARERERRRREPLGIVDRQEQSHRWEEEYRQH